MLLTMLLLLQATAPEAGQPAPEKAREKVICRSIEETGSRISSKRVCMTAAQWRQAQHDARNAVEEAQRVGFTR